MSRLSTPILAAAMTLTAATAVSAQDAGEFRRSAWHDYRIVTVAEGLVNPWSMAFLPNGDIVVAVWKGHEAGSLGGLEYWTHLKA